LGNFWEDETLMTRNMFVFGEVYAVLENGSWYGQWKSRIFPSACLDGRLLVTLGA